MSAELDRAFREWNETLDALRTEIQSLRAEREKIALENLRLIERGSDNELPWDCGQSGVCATAPGCGRHWQERNVELVNELRELKVYVDNVERDWRDSNAAYQAKEVKHRSQLHAAQELHKKSMDAIHEAAGIKQNGLAAILGWIDEVKSR